MSKSKRSGSSGPGDPPPRHPDCTCGPWKIVNGHWTFVIIAGCPVHTDG